MPNDPNAPERLYVVDWDPEDPKQKVIYKIEYAKIRSEVSPVDPENWTLSPLLPLLERNVAFAAVPENFGEGVACYLLNLNSLATKR
jgi:hypothetical protein